MKITATVFSILVSTLASTAVAAPLARISLVPTDLAGNAIATISPGASFLIEAIVQDIRSPASQLPGVFQASLNVEYDPALISVSGSAPFTWGTTFATFASPGDTSIAGHIQAPRAWSNSLSLPDNSAQMFFTVPAQATNPGIASLTPLFDSIIDPLHAVLLYGQIRRSD